MDAQEPLINEVQPFLNKSFELDLEDSRTENKCIQKINRNPSEINVSSGHSVQNATFRKNVDAINSGRLDQNPSVDTNLEKKPVGRIGNLISRFQNIIDLNKKEEPVESTEDEDDSEDGLDVKRRVNDINRGDDSNEDYTEDDSEDVDSSATYELDDENKDEDIVSDIKGASNVQNNVDDIQSYSTLNRRVSSIDAIIESNEEDIQESSSSSRRSSDYLEEGLSENAESNIAQGQSIVKDDEYRGEDLNRKELVTDIDAILGNNEDGCEEEWNSDDTIGFDEKNEQITSGIINNNISNQADGEETCGNIEGLNNIVQDIDDILGNDLNEAEEDFDSEDFSELSGRDKDIETGIITTSDQINGNKYFSSSIDNESKDVGPVEDIDAILGSDAGEGEEDWSSSDNSCVPKQHEDNKAVRDKDNDIQMECEIDQDGSINLPNALLRTEKEREDITENLKKHISDIDMILGGSDNEVGEDWNSENDESLMSELNVEDIKEPVANSLGEDRDIPLNIQGDQLDEVEKLKKHISDIDMLLGRTADHDKEVSESDTLSENTVENDEKKIEINTLNIETEGNHLENIKNMRETSNDITTADNQLLQGDLNNNISTIDSSDSVKAFERDVEGKGQFMNGTESRLKNSDIRILVDMDLANKNAEFSIKIPDYKILKGLNKTEILNKMIEQIEDQRITKELGILNSDNDVYVADKEATKELNVDITIFLCRNNYEESEIYVTLNSKNISVTKDSKELLKYLNIDEVCDENNQEDLISEVSIQKMEEEDVDNVMSPFISSKQEEIYITTKEDSEANDSIGSRERNLYSNHTGNTESEVYSTESQSKRFDFRYKLPKIEMASFCNKDVADKSDSEDDMKTEPSLTSSFEGPSKRYDFRYKLPRIELASFCSQEKLSRTDSEEQMKVYSNVDLNVTSPPNEFHDGPKSEASLSGIDQASAHTGSDHSTTLNLHSPTGSPNVKPLTNRYDFRFKLQKIEFPSFGKVETLSNGYNDPETDPYIRSPKEPSTNIFDFNIQLPTIDFPLFRRNETPVNAVVDSKSDVDDSVSIELEASEGNRSIESPTKRYDFRFQLPKIEFLSFGRSEETGNDDINPRVDLNHNDEGPGATVDINIESSGSDTIILPKTSRYDFRYQLPKIELPFFEKKETSLNNGDLKYQSSGNENLSMTSNYPKKYSSSFKRPGIKVERVKRRSLNLHDTENNSIMSIDRVDTLSIVPTQSTELKALSSEEHSDIDLYPSPTKTVYLPPISPPSIRSRSTSFSSDNSDVESPRVIKSKKSHRKQWRKPKYRICSPTNRFMDPHYSGSFESSLPISPTHVDDEPSITSSFCDLVINKPTSFSGIRRLEKEKNKFSLLFEAGHPYESYKFKIYLQDSLLTCSECLQGHWQQIITCTMAYMSPDKNFRMILLPTSDYTIAVFFNAEIMFDYNLKDSIRKLRRLTIEGDVELHEIKICDD